jgi:hypothetical protein
MLIMALSYVQKTGDTSHITQYVHLSKILLTPNLSSTFSSLAFLINGLNS